MVSGTNVYDFPLVVYSATSIYRRMLVPCGKVNALISRDLGPVLSVLQVIVGWPAPATIAYQVCVGSGEACLFSEMYFVRKL